MTENFFRGDASLPDDLKALDEELSSIQYEERPSFAPELRAELARAWAEGTPPARSGVGRRLAAAVVAALLLGGAAVPSARASFVRLISGFEPAPIERPEPVEELAEAIVEDVAAVTEPPVEVVEEPAPEPEPVEVVTPAVTPEVNVVPPQWVDRERARRIFRDAYPEHLQTTGVGGMVRVKVWVDEFGMASRPEIAESSGVRALDRAATLAATRLNFAPALQGDQRVGMLIEFPVVFEPDAVSAEDALAPLDDPYALPAVPEDERWQLEESIGLYSMPSEPIDESAGPRAAAPGLALVFSDENRVAVLGSAAAVLAGEAPEGIDPVAWRQAVVAELDFAIERGMETPAAMLAYGRIRLRQGLRTEARSLFERGLRIAVRGDRQVVPWVLAELHHERAALVRERWLASADVGRVRAEAFSSAECAQARSTGESWSGFASAGRLIAWNYLCSREVARVFEDGFEAAKNGAPADLALMMASYRAAIEAYPSHTGANTDLLLTLASDGRWEDALAASRRFVQVSGGHPNGLLMAGLALHRLDRTAEALDHFEAALERLPEETADGIFDVGVLLTGAERAWYRSLPVDERRSWEADYWALRDRSPSTEVNERWVEHLSRSSYAYFRFGEVFGDAKEVWVRFGGPNAIHIVDEGSGRLTEFWDYGSGPDITFVRWVSAKRTDLTPEGRAYVDDLGKIFPPQ